MLIDHNLTDHSERGIRDMMVGVTVSKQIFQQFRYLKQVRSNVK